MGDLVRDLKRNALVSIKRLSLSEEMDTPPKKHYKQ
jgi:hypothetical protein